LEQAIKLTKKALGLRQEIGNKKDIFSSLGNLAYLYELKGDLDTALEWRKTHLAKSQEWDDKYYESWMLAEIGKIYRRKGELSRALEYLFKAVELKEYISTIEYAWGLNDIGLIYYYKGELDQALDYYNRSFSLREKFDPTPICIECLDNMGLFFYATNEFEKAHESFSQALRFWQDLDNYIGVSKVLFRMIQINLSQNKTHRAHELFGRLETLKQENDHDSINTYYQLAHALMLKSSKRLRQKIEAEKIFSTLIKKETPLVHEITIIAIKHLCELLLDELRTYSEEVVLQEVKDLMLRLDNIGRSQQSFSIVVEALILQSKLTLLEGNLEKARHLLEQAELTASEKGMKYLEFQVQQEK